VEWVEHGIAPDKVIATKIHDGKTEVSRPLYNYPTTAIYKGSGDPASADSFVAKRAP
jgi:feruloyl esterase